VAIAFTARAIVRASQVFTEWSAAFSAFSLVVGESFEAADQQNDVRRLHREVSLEALRDGLGVMLPVKGRRPLYSPSMILPSASSRT